MDGMNDESSKFITVPYEVNNSFDEDELEEYCAFLHLDRSVDSEFEWIAIKGLQSPLPPEWKMCYKKGQPENVFFYNSKTGEISTDNPVDEYFRSLFLHEKRKKQLMLKFEDEINEMKKNHQIECAKVQEQKMHVDLKRSRPISLSLYEEDNGLSIEGPYEIFSTGYVDEEATEVEPFDEIEKPKSIIFKVPSSPKVAKKVVKIERAIDSTTRAIEGTVTGAFTEIKTGLGGICEQMAQQKHYLIDQSSSFHRQSLALNQTLQDQLLQLEAVHQDVISAFTQAHAEQIVYEVHPPPKTPQPHRQRPRIIRRDFVSDDDDRIDDFTSSDSDYSSEEEDEHESAMRNFREVKQKAKVMGRRLQRHINSMKLSFQD